MLSSASNGRNDWLIVATHPHKERVAVQQLQLQGFHHYCPLIFRRVKRRTRAYDVKKPLFPGYVFVSERSVGAYWPKIRSTIGVRSLLMSAGDVGRVPEQFIGAMKAREIDGLIRKPADKIEPGQLGKIRGGAFDGFVGDVLERRSNERVLMLLDLVEKPIKLVVRADDVDVVASSRY